MKHSDMKQVPLDRLLYAMLADARWTAKIPYTDAWVSSVQHLVGGLVGLILAMLMETVLLIIRTSVSPRSKAEEILLRHDKKTQEAKLQQAREAAVRQALDPGMHRAGSDRVSADGDSALPAVPPEVKKEQ